MLSEREPQLAAQINYLERIHANTREFNSLLKKFKDKRFKKKKRKIEEEETKSIYLMKEEDLKSQEEAIQILSEVKFCELSLHPYVDETQNWL